MPTLKILCEGMPDAADGIYGTLTVSDADWPDVKGALLRHEAYGYVVQTSTVSVQEGTDADGNPIMVDREVTTRNPATLAQAMQNYADKVKADVVQGANAYRKGKLEAQKLAEAAAAFKPINPAD